DIVLPQGMTLSPELELQNRVRCYCQIVKAKEKNCIDRLVPRSICLERTRQWVEKNLRLPQAMSLVNGVGPVPVRDRMINVEP
ncbi:MAG: hypothetical protein NZ811_02675, partial [Gammaproteobacteria bacterium]|nr:hypothetical protein [Gammaproteobacteria bacterium]